MGFTCDMPTTSRKYWLKSAHTGMVKSNLWNEELSEEQTQALITKISHEIVRRKMETPAILALEMHKPLSNLVAHAAVGAFAFIAPILGVELFNDLTRLLSKRDNVERLIQAIELESQNSEEQKA